MIHQLFFLPCFLVFVFDSSLHSLQNHNSSHAVIHCSPTSFGLKPPSTYNTSTATAAIPATATFNHLIQPIFCSSRLFESSPPLLKMAVDIYRDDGTCHIIFQQLLADRAVGATFNHLIQPIFCSHLFKSSPPISKMARTYQPPVDFYDDDGNCIPIVIQQFKLLAGFVQLSVGDSDLSFNSTNARCLLISM